MIFRYHWASNMNTFLIPTIVLQRRLSDGRWHGITFYWLRFYADIGWTPDHDGQKTT